MEESEKKRRTSAGNNTYDPDNTLAIVNDAARELHPTISTTPTVHRDSTLQGMYPFERSNKPCRFSLHKEYSLMLGATASLPLRQDAPTTLYHFKLSCFIFLGERATWRDIQAVGVRVNALFIV
jgi:hypothetical protein